MVNDTDLNMQISHAFFFHFPFYFSFFFFYLFSLDQKLMPTILLIGQNNFSSSSNYSKHSHS